MSDYVDKDKGRKKHAGQSAVHKLPQERNETTEGDVVSANITNEAEAEGYGYISHFATCPGAAGSRKR